MKKKLLTLAILACGALGFTAVAQDEGLVAVSEEATLNPNNKMYQPQVFTDYAFEGIILDTDQQAQMDKINEQYKPIVNGTLVRGQASCPGDSARCKNKDKAFDRSQAPCDSAQCKGKGPRDGRRGGDRPGLNPQQLQQARKAYAEQVKQVLTPEQYVVFLENIAFAPQQPQGPQRAMQAPKGGHGQKAKGQRLERQQRQATPVEAQ